MNMFLRASRAGVVKLVDAEDSKSSDRKVVRVRFSPPAPEKKPGRNQAGLFEFVLMELPALTLRRLKGRFCLL